MSDNDNILSLLEGTDPDSIREGARLAGASRLIEAIPLLASHINSQNIGVQEAVDRALRKIGGAEVVHAVIPMLRSDDAPVRNLSMDILRELGKADLNALQELLHDEDPDIRIFSADILGSVGSVLAVPHLAHALLHDPEVNVRYQAAVSLGSLAFSEAAVSLNQALDDEEWVQFSVIEALTKIRDESSVNAMFKALANASDLVASTIVDALGEMGNVKAVPLLLKRLESSPMPLCNKIVKAIVCIMGEKSLTLLGIKECERLKGYMSTALADEDPEVQDAAIKGLAVLGGEGAAASILKLAESFDPEQDADRVANVIKSLIKIGNGSEIENALINGTELSMRIAMQVMLQTDEQKAVAFLIDIFWDKSRDLQRDIIAELASRAKKDNQDFFIDILARHQDGNVLRGALLFLGREGDADKVYEKIIPLLSHSYDDVKEAALDACIALHTPEIMEYFKTLTKHHDPVQRMMSVYALGFYNIQDVLNELKDALNDESPDVRKVAVESFGRGCPISDEFLSLVEHKLNDENREVRMAVFDTLGLCSDERYTAALILGLSDDDPWVKVRCAEHLGEKKSVAAVERLVYLLGDANNLVAIKAIGALGMIGGETAFRALLPMLENADHDIVEAAEEAINHLHRQAGE